MLSHVCISAADGFEEVVPSELAVDSRTANSATMTVADTASKETCTEPSSVSAAAASSATQTDFAASIAVHDVGCQFSVPDEHDDNADDNADDTDNLVYEPCENAAIGCPVHVLRGQTHRCLYVQRPIINATASCQCRGDAEIRRELDTMLKLVEEQGRTLASITNMLAEMKAGSASSSQAAIPALASTSITANSASSTTRPVPSAPRSASLRWGCAPDVSNYITLHVRCGGGRRHTLRNIATDSTIDQLKRIIAATMLMPSVGASGTSGTSAAPPPAFDLFAVSGGRYVKLDPFKDVAHYQPADIWDGSEMALLFRPRGTPCARFLLAQGSLC